MGKITCGLYVVNKDGKVLICHPTHHPVDFYTIPKGKCDETDDSYLDTAVRETYEESNLDFSEFLKDGAPIVFHYLGDTMYRNKRKRIYGFAIFEKDFEHIIKLDEIELKCDSMVDHRTPPFPEIDGYRWVDFDEAENLLHEAQVENLLKVKNIWEKLI